MAGIAKRWLWLGALILAATFVVSAVVATASTTGSFDERVRKIKAGMTKAEVDNLIGSIGYAAAGQPDGRLTCYTKEYRSFGDPGAHILAFFVDGPEERI